MKVRYAFTVLAVLTLVLAGASILFTVNYVKSTDRAVVTAATETPVQKPADPAANPSREQQWEWYVRFVRLGQDLGC